MFLPDVKSIVFGKNAGLTNSELDKMSTTNPFSQYLNYSAYDEEDETYYNADDTIGWVWECNPIIFAGEKTINTIEGLFRGGIPDNSVLSLTLIADPYLGNFLNNFEKCRTRDNEMIRGSIVNMRKYLEGGVYGVKNLSQIPARNFRLLVSLKIPATSAEAEGGGWGDLKNQIRETLSGCGISMGEKGPLFMDPPKLLDWARRLFNDDCPDNYETWDEEIPLRKQIIKSETVVKDGGDYLQFGRRSFRCMTPKVNPKEVDPMMINELFGGYRGVVSDADQIKSPFMFTMNVFFQPLRKKLHGKCNFVLSQKNFGSLTGTLQRKQAEYLKATDKIEKGVPYVRVMPIFWVWGQNEKEALDSITRARRIWEARGYMMQIDRGILKIMFLAALPMGLIINKGKTLDNLERDFIVDSEALAPTLPIQGDYAGAGFPKTVLFGRKGQVASLDFWAEGANNMNGLVLGGSGGGKSYLANDIVFGNYSCGANIRILDVGRSYKKMVKMLGAKFLDFFPNNPISLNPFTNIINPSEELSPIVDIVALMAFASNPTEQVSTIEKNLLRSAVRWAWATAGNGADTGLVHKFLVEFPANPSPVVNEETKNNIPLEQGERITVVTDKIVECAKHLAFQLQEFIPGGDFGGFFSGPCVFDIRKDSCVVTELQELRGMPELYRVVTGLVVNAYLQDVYQKKDLSIPTFLCFDEGWQYLDTKQGGAGDLLAPVLERLARTCRKANAGMLLITQSILDLQNFGSAGRALWNNSEFKVFLQSNDLMQPEVQDLLGYDDFSMSLLRSIQSQVPRYSELFIDSPFGKGVARMARDPYSYYINTSKGSEVAEIERLVDGGKSYHQAIEIMIDKYHKG